MPELIVVVVSALLTWWLVAGVDALPLKLLSPAYVAVRVRGPALVRRAAIQAGTLALAGDTTEISALEVWAPPNVAHVTWNDAAIESTSGNSRSLVAVHPLRGPDKVILDRAHNRHVAFGSGIHRCAGSNLARMELRVAIEEWLRRIPEFHIEPGAEVTWAGGQVRGPRSVPVVFP